MGYTDPPDCPAALSQLHGSSLEVMGFEVRCPANTGQEERGEELWGPLPSHLTFRMGHMGLCCAVSSRDLHIPPMDSTLRVFPSVICLRLSFCSFQNLFLLTQKSPEGAELVFCKEVDFGIWS